VVKVERGITVPIRGRKPIYPWRELNVGDSFEVKKPINKISKLAMSAARTLGARFTCRTVGKNRTRVWRWM
jgi:hypothetical protein